MGIPVDDDIGELITNGDFDSSGDWDVRTPWNISGGNAILWRTSPVENGLRQYNRNFLQGNSYRIIFNLLIADFVNEPAKGVIVNTMNHSFGPFNTVGIKSIDVFNSGTSTAFSFFTNSTDVGDYAVISEVSVMTLGPYVVETLGIDWPRVRKTEFSAGELTDYYQTLASFNGGTNCLISYDIP